MWSIRSNERPDQSAGNNYLELVSLASGIWVQNFLPKGCASERTEECSRFAAVVLSNVKAGRTRGGSA
jgi:hypothetical protein